MTSTELRQATGFGHKRLNNYLQELRTAGHLRQANVRSIDRLGRFNHVVVYWVEE